MARRGHGEGSLYHRKDPDRWEAILSLPDGRRKTLTGKSRQEVQRKLTQAQRDLEQGITPATARQTVGEFLDHWLATKRPDLAPRTYDTYEQFCRRHIVPLLGRTPLPRLSAQQAQQAQNQWREQGLSGTSVGHLHAMLKQALRDAVRLGLIARNPLDQLDKPKRRRRAPQVLTQEQAQRLIAACGPESGERLGALLVMALSTGMRQGELLALRWRDVDLDAAQICVQASLQRVRDDQGVTRPVLKEPKTAHSRRTIAISAGLLDALRAHRQRQRLERVALGRAWADLDLVFANEVGRPLDPRNVTRRVYERLLRQEGLPRITFHALRHTAATLLLSRGVNPKIVSEMLGHASVSITLDLYSHVLPHMQTAASQAMHDALWG